MQRPAASPVERGGGPDPVTDGPTGRRDFFVSFNQADRAWATWIAWVLEEAGYSEGQMIQGARQGIVPIMFLAIGPDRAVVGPAA